MKVLMLLLILTEPSWAHDSKAWSQLANGDSRRSDWFNSLKQPSNGISCCNISDCQQTQARQRPDQSWEAVIDDYKGHRWVAIPPDKVVKRPLSIDGEAYICASKGSAGGMVYEGSGEMYKASPYDATIYCFVPPIPGY